VTLKTQTKRVVVVTFIIDESVNASQSTRRMANATDGERA